MSVRFDSGPTPRIRVPGPAVIRSWRSSRGIALLGVTVLLAIAAMTLGVLAMIPYLEAANVQEQETQALLRRVVVAITGDRETTFGYLGDMGRLPPTLASLVTPETPAYSNTTTRLNVGMGWNGPYLRDGEFFAGDELDDAWGRPLVYETTSSGGVLTTATIRSTGADGVASTSDDLISETIQALATLKVFAWKETSGNISPQFGGRLYFSSNGAQSSVGVSPTDAGGPAEDYFLYSSVAVGRHAFLMYHTQSGVEFAVATFDVHPGVANQVRIGYND